MGTGSEREALSAHRCTGGGVRNDRGGGGGFIVARARLVPISADLLSRRGRRPFFHTMRPDAMRKSGNVTSEPCDKADDAKYSFPKGAVNNKYTFFQWILQISGCNKWCKKGA